MENAKNAHEGGPREPNRRTDSFLDLLIPVFGGTCLGYCFHLPSIAWAAPLGLGALSYAVQIRSRSVSALSAYCGLFAYHLIGLRFLHQTGHRELGYWWPLLAAGLAGVTLSYLPIARALTRRLGIRFILAFPIAWVAAETIRYWATVPFLDVPFPFLSVGATLHQQFYLLQCADIFGGSGLTLLVAMIAAAIGDVLALGAGLQTKPNTLRKNWVVTCIIVLLAFTYGMLRSSTIHVTPGPTIALVPKLFPRGAVDSDTLMGEECRTLKEHFKSDLSSSVDLWVWSEMALISDLGNQHPDRWDRLHRMRSQLGGSLLIGAPRASSETTRHNSCFCIGPTGSNEQYYDKVFLGPGDEFQPRVGRWLSQLTGRRHLDPHSLNWAVHSPGARTPVFTLPYGHDEHESTFGTTICFDIWFSTLFREYFSQAKDGETPEFFVNIADEVFTGDREFSYAYWALVETRLRAIETRRAVVRNCGDGYSAIVWPSGSIERVEGGAANEKDVFVAQVPLSGVRSVYMTSGNVIPAMSILVSAWGLLVAVFTYRVTLPEKTFCGTTDVTGFSDLSVIVPVFNEKDSIRNILTRVRAVAPNAEIIAVDDGSKDGSRNILEELERELGIHLCHHESNKGKGAAIRTGLAQTTRRFTIIQDADEEYCPEDFEEVLSPLREMKAIAVFGSRFQRGEKWRRPPWRIQDIAIGGLNVLVFILFGERITDEATCYKAFDSQVLKSLCLKCDGFEFCPEVTAKILRSGYRIVEVPIRYSPRTYEEGKKIRWTHAVTAAWTLLKWRFLPIRQRLSRP